MPLHDASAPSQHPQSSVPVTGTAIGTAQDLRCKASLRLIRRDRKEGTHGQARGMDRFSMQKAVLLWRLDRQAKGSDVDSILQCLLKQAQNWHKCGCRLKLKQAQMWSNPKSLQGVQQAGELEHIACRRCRMVPHRAQLQTLTCRFAWPQCQENNEQNQLMHLPRVCPGMLQLLPMHNLRYAGRLVERRMCTTLGRLDAL